VTLFNLNLYFPTKQRHYFTSASSTDTGHFLFAEKLDKAAPQKPHSKAYWVQKTGQEHT
jgi:hypothetical protein